MVDYVTKFQTILVNLGLSERFFCFLRNLLKVFIPVSRDVLAFSGRLVSLYIRRGGFYDFRVGQ